MRKALFLLLCAACGDNNTGIPFEELEAVANRARCDRLVRCGLFPDDGSCVTFFRKDPQVNLRAALERDIVRYDGASARQCEEALALVGCNELERDARVLPESCELMFRGTREDGATCAVDEECRSGLCDAPGCPEGQCCTGTCGRQRYAKLDEICVADLDCFPDAYCASTMTCQPLVGVGGECRSDRQCGYGLGCIGANQFMPGNCRKLPLLGEPCPYMRCAEIGAYCSGGTCMARGLPGAVCESNADCSPFMECSESKVCAALPRLAEPCTSRCAGESTCNVDTGRCEAPRADGELCTSGDQCESLVCVDGPAFESCIPAPVCIP